MFAQVECKGGLEVERGRNTMVVSSNESATTLQIGSWRSARTRGASRDLLVHDPGRF